MSTSRPRRSVLYMPGSNARALDKAKTLAADAVILDLEDAVAPAEKVEARTRVADAVRNGGYGTREVIVRINGLSTEWGADDLAAAADVRPDAILVPKVSTAGDIVTVADRLKALDADPEIALWAMVETPQAIFNARMIGEAGTAPGGRLACFVMGTNDLAKETGARITPDRLPMAAWLSMAVLAARASAIAVIDGVYNDFRDAEGFAAECAQGRDFGMDGKTLIHPNQIATANAVFAPSAEEIAWSEKVIAAFAEPENAGKGAITVDGRMVELLHADMARKTVAIATAIAAAEMAA